jgi:Fe-S cluster assembly scaffold IscU
MAYSEKVLDHYENPRNVGSFDKTQQDIGTGLVGAPACGDVMQLQIQVVERDGAEFIKEARFKTYGCGSAIASSSYATELLQGLTLEEALEKVKNENIAKDLALPPVKFHCSVLAEDAIRSAVIDYQNKKKSRHDASISETQEELVLA